MTQPPKENLPQKKQPPEKIKRREDALRANLMKRKQQARARTTTSQPETDDKE